MVKSRVKVIVKGIVQGVNFRYYAQRQAAKFNLTGWVKNRRDGGVEVVAEGLEDRVKQLVVWCHQGPSHARVTDVHQTREEWQGEFDSFDIAF